MKRILLYILLIFLFTGCKNNEASKHSPLSPIYSPGIESSMIASDSVELRHLQDSISREEFIADSLEFRRITKLINGGYNGFDDRWRLYIIAKKILKDTLNY